MTLKVLTVFMATLCIREEKKQFERKLNEQKEQFERKLNEQKEQYVVAEKKITEL